MIKIKVENIKLYNGDCLEVMDRLIEQGVRVDMILCDLPYSTTSCKWDKLIPMDELWERYENLITDKGAIVLFGQEPFSSNLRLSNKKLYKYDWKWIKSKVGNFLNSKNSPLKKYEDIMVFSKGTIANGSPKLMVYNPQGLIEVNQVCSNSIRKDDTTIGNRKSRESGNYVKKFKNYPNNLLEFQSEDGFHPTQKPVTLLEYLVKTYTHKEQIVLDNTMGSGSTGVACLNTNRKFIGIELDDTYYEIAKNRIEETLKNQGLQNEKLV